MSSWLSVVIQVRDLTHLRVMSNWLSVVVQLHDLALESSVKLVKYIQSVHALTLSNHRVQLVKYIQAVHDLTL